MNSSGYASLLVLAALLGVSQASIKCYQCASPALKYKWQLTSFPGRPLDSSFAAECTTGSATPTVMAGWLVDCNSECVSYFFDMLSESGGKTAVAVRGCYESLLGTNVRSQTQYLCGTKPAKDLAYGTTIQLGQELQFCNNVVNANAGCNAGSAANCGNAPATTNCHECTTSSSDCSSGSCNGTYCTKDYSYLNGRRTVTKGCSAVNPYQSTRCVDLTSQALVPIFRSAPRSPASRSKRSTVEIKDRRCYCQGNYCNGASTLSVFGLATLGSLLLSKLVSFNNWV